MNVYYSATYSPQDDKLRLYATSRLTPEDYAKVKAAGFGWAPKQECFYAVWTPGREDLVLTFADDIEDETTTREDRAVAREERFRSYEASRRRDAERASAAVSAIADNIPLGQPILVGHHSERHARRDQERIENGMRRAVDAWKTADYWRGRAGACVAHADYLERPDVRARRIKGLEADLRKYAKHKKECAIAATLWEGADTFERVLAVANIGGGAGVSACFPLEKYPRLRPDASQYEGPMSLWSALNGGVIGHETARAIALRAQARSTAHYQRWIEHLEGRLCYERAMLGELPADTMAFAPGGRVRAGSKWFVILRVNKSGGRVVSLSVVDRYIRSLGVEKVEEYEPPTEERAKAVKKVTTQPPLCNYPSPDAVEMTADEWSRLSSRKWADVPTTQSYGATETTGAHRRRVQYRGLLTWSPVFITDQKRTDPPAATPPPGGGGATAAEVLRPEVEVRKQVERAEDAAPRPPAISPERVAAEARLAAGVSVVVAHDLFPTPPDLARRMVELAQLQDKQRVLEPSAGTGNLVEAIAEARPSAWIVAAEINNGLCRRLNTFPTVADVFEGDFLEMLPGADGIGLFDRVLMNPPFSNGADIRHIQHAAAMLKPEGRLVALCAAGPRQEAALRPLASTWEVLPGTPFAPATNVRVALLTIAARP